MANGKFSNGKRSNLKPVALLLAIALLVGTAVGGTLAWLTDKTDPVKNTFTVGNVDIELDETTGEEYKMIPGYTIDKDPKITVKADSEKSWVFVEVVKSGNFDKFMTYAIAEGWNELKTEGLTTIYYREQAATTEDVIYSVLAGDKVHVKDTVTKEMMDSFDTNDDGTLSESEKAALPTLTFTAYAVQFNKSNTEKFEPADAWAIAKAG